MAELVREVLLYHRDAFVQSADDDDVFLGNLLDHLESKGCIQRDHRQLVKRGKVSRVRMGLLLDFVSFEGQQAFNELCNALDKFGTEDKRALADLLRRSWKESNVAGSTNCLTCRNCEMHKTEVAKQRGEYERKLAEYERKLTALRDVLQGQNLNFENLNFEEEAICSQPELIHSMDEENIILGLTTLQDELYVLHGRKMILKVYDTTIYCLQRQLSMSGVVGVVGMTSCAVNAFIYIADDCENLVFRVDKNNAVTQWCIRDQPYGVSVNSAGSVLVTCSDKFKEFSFDGTFLRVINLPSDVLHPYHTVELRPGSYVVCHGVPSDTSHRVCLVDSQGRVSRSYGGMFGSSVGQLNTPRRLAVSGNNVYVLEVNNGRVSILSPTLDYVGEFVSGLRGPMEIQFDKEASRLYVVENKWANDNCSSGSVRVYKVQQ